MLNASSETVFSIQRKAHLSSLRYVRLLLFLSLRAVLLGSNLSSIVYTQRERGLRNKKEILTFVCAESVGSALSECTQELASPD